MKYVTAPKGLAAARNAGLRAARGNIICFFDDDVMVGTDFLANVAEFFRAPEMADVGGMTAFDATNCSSSHTVPFRWRLRYWMGITPSLEPGFCTHLGRSVPLAFLGPFRGSKQIHWLPGHCQIFRATAVSGLQYDEASVVEDRDFSMEVGKNWRLVVCGDIRIEHRRDSEARHCHVQQTWRASFGLGRSFAKRQRSRSDKMAAVHVVAGEFLLDVATALVRPSIPNWRIPWTRVSAFVAGYRSIRRH